MCAHSLYPCFYFNCDDQQSKLNENSKILKCAKNLIFDDKIQRCVWAMPWQTCKLESKDDLIKAIQQPQPQPQLQPQPQPLLQFQPPVQIGFKAEKKPTKTNKSYLNLIEASPSIVFNGNKKLGEKISNSLFESLALSLKLKDISSPLDENSSKSQEPRLLPASVNRLDLLITSPKLNEKRQTTLVKAPNDPVGVFVRDANRKIAPSGFQAASSSSSSSGNTLNNVKNTIQVSQQVEYYDSDFNVTVSDDDDQDNVEFDENGDGSTSTTDQYAYIVVPIKISKNRKLPDFGANNNAVSAHHDTSKKKNKKVMKESKNLEGINTLKQQLFFTSRDS